MRPAKIDLILVKNHENCFNTESIKTDAALSFAKLYRSRDISQLYNPISNYFNEHYIGNNFPNFFHFINSPYRT